MEKFVQRENLKHLREVLARTTDKPECQRIVNVIEAEEAKKREESRPPQLAASSIPPCRHRPEYDRAP